MLRTLAVVALKGGSGKTTIATHLALAAHLRGIETLVADIDPQRSTSLVLSAREGPGPDCITTDGSGLLSAQIAAGGLRRGLMIIDTAAGALEDAAEAVVLADFVVLVVRPTLLDLSALARTMTLVRRLKRPFVVVVNQAPPARGGVENPAVVRALRALAYMRAAVAPVIVRNRTVYQTALETGRSAEELSDQAGAREMAALWEHVDLRAEAGPDDDEVLSALADLAPASPGQ